MDIGVDICKEAIKRRVWELEAYLLTYKLSQRFKEDVMQEEEEEEVEKLIEESVKEVVKGFSKDEIEIEVDQTKGTILHLTGIGRFLLVETKYGVTLIPEPS